MLCYRHYDVSVTLALHFLARAEVFYSLFIVIVVIIGSSNTNA